jgi:hypothetical protein
VIEESGTLVASVRLSPTHTIDFVDYGDVARVRETLHADRDRDASMTLGKMQVGHRPLAEIYELFAAGKADRDVAGRLRGVDERLARASLSAPAARPIEARPAEATPADRDDLETRQGELLPASCPEPNWNWQNDHAWYLTNFCTGSPAFCSVNQNTKQQWGWDGPLRRFEAIVFNQSHCAPQGWWQLKWRNNTGTHQPTNTVICPRCVQSDVWSGGTNVQYFNSMEPREVGKRVGMTIYRTP